MTILDVVFENWRAYLSGLLVTLKLCGTAWTGGLLIGGAVALAAEWLPRGVGWPVNVLSRMTEAIPILVLLFWFHYPVQAALGVTIDPFLTTAVLLTVLNSLAIFGILRRAIVKVPIEYVDAARVCGVRQGDIFWSIKLPLAIRSALGAITSSQVNILQLSIFGSLISVEELFRISQRINAQIYKPIQVYSGLALFFLAVCLPLNLLARHLDRRLS
jgi:His/Glu/Gln/Arg/opine family amino acid ABC transporter permease subunit